MALSNADAIAVNTIVDWLGERDNTLGPVAEDDAREALGFLADRAHRQLACGVGSDDVDEIFAARKLAAEAVGGTA